MADDDCLFDENWRKLSRRRDPVTSHAAAREHVTTGRHADQCQVVLRLVLSNPGCTSDELAEIGGLTRHVTGRRLPDLEKKGRIRRGEIRPSRLTGRGGLTWWPVSKEKPDEHPAAVPAPSPVPRRPEAASKPLR